MENDRHKTAKNMSDESHLFIGWEIAQDRETIPYQLARIRLRPLTAEEKEHARSLEHMAVQALKSHASPC